MMWTAGIQMKWVCDHCSESQFKQLRKSPKKEIFGASMGFEPVASALALHCSTSLSYEDPYAGDRPIYWVHQPMKGMKHRMKWCELREYKWKEYVTIAVNRNLSNCEKARKKDFRGFNGIWARGLCVSAAVLYQPELWRPICWRPANSLSSSTRERNETQNEMMWTARIQMKFISTNEIHFHGFESRWSPENLFFRLFCNCLNYDSLRWSHAHFICIPAVHIISFCVSFLSWVDELNKLAGLQHMGLHSSGW